MDIADVLAGTHCIEIAELGELRIPMRAVSEAEREHIAATARATVCMELPGAPRAELVEDASWPILVALSALHPERLREGVRAPLFRVADVRAMLSDDVDALLVAQVRAQRRACPPLRTESEWSDLFRSVTQHIAEHPWLRHRAHHTPIVDFFGVASARELTDHQIRYYTELRA